MGDQKYRGQKSPALGYAFLTYGLINSLFAGIGLADLPNRVAFAGTWARDVVIVNTIEAIAAVSAGVVILVRPRYQTIAVVFWSISFVIRVFPFSGYKFPLSWNAISYLFNLCSIPIGCSVGAIVHWRSGNSHSVRNTSPVCGNCSYILKGLSEPRCPECGRTYTLDEFYQL